MSWPALILALVSAAAPLTEDPDFLRAKAQYADLEFEDAMNALKRAAARPYSDQERASLEVWMGMCSAQLRDDLGVRAHFAQAVALNIEVALPGFAPPKVAELLEEARGEQRARLASQAPPEVPEDVPPGDGDGDGDAAQGDPTPDVPDEDPNGNTNDGAVVDGAVVDGALADVAPDNGGGTIPPADEGSSVVPWVATGSLGAGAVVMVVAGTALTVGGYYLASLSTDPTQYQADAQLYAYAAMGLYAGAGVAGVVVVGLGAAAGASAVWALVE